MARAIDGDELLGIERLLDTDVIRKSKTASWLLDQVLHDIQAMPTLTPPNEPLTLKDVKKERYIWFTPLNDWAKVTPFGVLFFGSEELITWETLCEEWGHRFKAYRRPPEGEV